MCPWDMEASLWQTGSRHMTDLKRVTLIMLQTKHQINLKCTSRETDIHMYGVKLKTVIKEELTLILIYDIPVKLTLILIYDIPVNLKKDFGY